MRDSVRHFAAEFVGIFALVFVGGAAIMSGAIAKAPTTWLNVALAHGIILAVMVSATMRISGHLNPAVTIGFLVARRIEPVMAGVYIIAQLLGAMLAAYVLKALYPAAVVEATRLGGQSLALDVSMTQGIMYEAIATFFLVFVVFGTAVDPKAPKIGGLAIGPLTGGSMNPARSFGPAVANGFFEAQAVYWIGPLLGGVAAALLYDSLFLRRDIEPADHGAVRPVT